MLLTRAPLYRGRSPFSFDLHVLGAPLTFVLSQDQTLQLNLVSPRGAIVSWQDEVGARALALEMWRVASARRAARCSDAASRSPGTHSSTSFRRSVMLRRRTLCERTIQFSRTEEPATRGGAAPMQGGDNLVSRKTWSRVSERFLGGGICLNYARPKVGRSTQQPGQDTCVPPPQGFLNERGRLPQSYPALIYPYSVGNAAPGRLLTDRSTARTGGGQ